MIKKLRRHFILITLISIALVLGVMMSAINIANYHSVNIRADEKLSVIADNDGTFPKKNGEKSYKPFDYKMLEKKMTAEAPFDTRYFTVKVTDKNTIVSVNTGMIAAVSTEKAINYTNQLTKKNKTSGFIDNYKYTCVDTDDGKMYIFLDCERELSTFYNFLIVSILASVGGIILVYLLVLVFSKIVFKPVAESYEKQKQFITDASHEIKTPLTIIDASTEIIEMENGENEWTESIKNQVKRLTALTEKLVFLSRMDEESTKLIMLDFSISDAVLEVAQGFEAVATSQGKTLNLDIDNNLSYCGDETTIRQLVSLLIDNAMKYSDENGKGGSILVSGSFVSYEGSYAEYNSDLLLSATVWMSGGEESFDIAPKFLSLTALKISQLSIVLWGLAVIFVIPFAIFIWGLFVWFRRRNL